jgi:hypothetical protein
MRIQIFNKENSKIYSVPVNSGSKYTWKLEESDYVTIIFESHIVLHLSKGDYCNIDDIGRFEIVDLPKPDISTKADGYEYELRMDRPWYRLKNRIHFMKRGTINGMQAKWSLTDTIANHAAVILEDINAIGYKYGDQAYEVEISSEIDADESELVEFDSTSILDAIGKVADAFDTEWWFDGNVLHFGKCQQGDAVTLEVGDNLSNLTRQDDSSVHGTRLYAFGSSRNLNDNYRRELSNPFTINGFHKIYDSTIKLILTKPKKWYSKTMTLKFLTGKYADASFVFTVASGSYDSSTWDNPVFQIDLGTLADDSGMLGATQVQFIIGDATGGQSDDSIATIASWSRDSYYGFSFDTLALQEKALMSSTTITLSDGTVTGIEYKGVLKDSDGNSINEARYVFKRSDGKSFGSLTSDSVTLANVKMAYISKLYTKPQDGDEEVATQGVSSNELMLPKGTPYIDSEDGLDKDSIIEIVNQYDDIYPRALLTITEVTEIQASTTDSDTGNISYWTAYRFKAKLQDGSAFHFDKDYIISGETLSVHFASGLLNGMEFEVGFNPDGDSDETFEITRNENYTLALPNDITKPKVGDTLYMYNMDVSIIDDSLVSAAENELKEQAIEDMEVYKEDDGTYTATTNPIKKINLPYGQKVAMVSEALFLHLTDYSRTTRVLGWEKNLDDIYSAEYTCGETSVYNRLDNLSNQLDETIYNNGQITTKSDGSVSVETYEKKITEMQKQITALQDNLDTKLSKILEDSAKKKISFLEGLTINEFVSGQYGKGGQIDADANAELRSLTLREFLEVPEFRYNRIEIQIGNRWRAPGGGIIESFTPDKDADGNELSTGIINLHLEDGEIGTIGVDDICQGIYHDGMTLSNNSTDDYDDGVGNFRFSGFYTCYFRITEIIETGNNSSFRYALRPVSDNYPTQYQPHEAMHFVGYGNFTDSTRQSSRYSTLTYERYLTGVKTWEFSESMVAAQFGDLSNLNVFGLSMAGYSAYLDNIYMSGTIEQFEKLPVRIDVTNSGDGFLAYGESCDITCKVMRGFTDLTDTVSTWTITRDSGSTPDDKAWNLSDKAKGFDGTITLAFTETENDIGSNSNVYTTIFTVTAIGSDGAAIASAEITI